MNATPHDPTRLSLPSSAASLLITCSPAGVFLRQNNHPGAHICLTWGETTRRNQKQKKSRFRYTHPSTAPPIPMNSGTGCSSPRSHGHARWDAVRVEEEIRDDALGIGERPRHSPDLGVGQVRLVHQYSANGALLSVPAGKLIAATAPYPAYRDGADATLASRRVTVTTRV